MWSHRIWVNKPKITIGNVNIGGTKKIIFPTQEDYAGWLKEQPIPIGQLFVYSGCIDATNTAPPNMKILVGFQPLLEDLAYSYDGLPKYLLLLDIAKNYGGAFPISYEGLSLYRPFTGSEMEWAKDNVVVQNHIKDALEFFEHEVQ